jgi:GDPmannose 4,6-dehydratase
MKTAVITGVAGQDGSYLSELLLSKGYNVIGITRRKSTSMDLSNLEDCFDNENFSIIYGDILDPLLINNVVNMCKPDEWYNLAAMSHVGQSFFEPSYVFRVNAESVIMQLDIIRNGSPKTKFYQASTSELYGTSKCPDDGFTEESIMSPQSPYAIAKLAAYHAVKNYRKAYSMYACNGILFNHSSPRRGLDFATRKITNGLAHIKFGFEDCIKMGNLSAFRDEGHSKDYCRAMHLMLQQETPDDFVIATGSGATIEEMFKYVCSIANIDFESGYKLDERFIRPSDVPYLLGNPSKAKNILSWEPKYTWKDLLKEMYEYETYSY